MKNGLKTFFAVHMAGILKYCCLRLLYFTSRFPLSVRYCITNLLSFCVFLFCYSKRISVRKNLRTIFKREPSTFEVLKVFASYGRYWAELPTVNEIWSSSSKVFHNPGFPPENKSFLGVTFHIGNFEMFGNVMKQVCNSEFNVVAERLRPQYITDLFKRIRSRHLIKTFMHDDIRHVLHVLKSGNALGVLCDRMVGGRGVEVRLFGKRVRMPLNIVDYALQKKIPIYISYCINQDGVINIYSHKIDPETDFDTAVGTILATLEDAIVRFPFQWHMLNAL